MESLEWMEQPRFDVFTINENGHITRMFQNVSLTTAELLAGVERHEFDNAIMRNGWVGTCPAWTRFKPVVIIHNGTLIKHDQFVFLIDLAG